MLLQTDDQTMEDLRLFARREQPGIYDIYNNTFTRGGEAVLEEMFRNPLSDREQIIARSSVIAAFAKLGTTFPFRPVLLDNIEKYLSQSAQHRDGQRGTLGEKEIAAGVMAAIELLHAVRDFVEKGDAVKVEGLSQQRKNMTLLLQDEGLQPVFNEKPGAKLSYAAITAYDILVRVRERKKFIDVLHFIYLVDVYISVATMANKHQFIFPVVHTGPGRVINVQGVFHPALKAPIGNDIRMDGQRSVVFLTGANMAGKSTFLRSLSIAVYIAHMGFPVAAKAMEFSIMDGLYTTINLPDNLGIGASHFYAEVLRVKRIAVELNAGRSIFVVFDELFRGTNVKDAHEGTVEITRAFARKSNSLFIISSHIVEAANTLKQQPTIGFYYLPTRMNGNTPEYTYTLQEGVTDDRHGMIIIRNENILDILAAGKKNG
ncbi:DNA mismatch repair protein [Paraflavitalea soli]|uniref:DNA mismatch repair protein n=1 Tax=Paraflavitalea soli TaxID=2315862 RepID=A0A3B7MHL9_9BACT|nr:DNA mismatch repair protein [Paraflavitalea soli]AXY73708.1 DNA mismatch repair protein [Paraflavitalea soli]